MTVTAPHATHRVASRRMPIDVAADADRLYEGPFDLLLHLILAEEVDIHEVRLARIVDAYLVELERMQQLDLDVATEFLLIAATLVELKARRLLPGRVEIDLDEEFALWEERDLLLTRLLECKTFKDVRGSFGRAGRSRRPQRGPPRRSRRAVRRPDADLLAGVTPLRLQAAIAAFSPRPVPRRIDLQHVAPLRASVADAVGELVDKLPRAGRIAFARLAAALVERLEVIVRFLAVLELFKQGLRRARAGRPLRCHRHRVARGGRPPIGGDHHRHVRRLRRRGTEADPRAAHRRGGVPPGDRGGGARGATTRSRPSCWPSCSSVRSATSSAGATSSPPATPPTAAGSSWSRRRRLPLPDPSRPRPVRRAVRAPRPAGASIGCGARDARDRRLQAADLPGPGGSHPRGRIPTACCARCRARLHRRRRPGPRARQALLFGTTPAFLEKLGLDSIEDLPPIADFIPGAYVVEALEAGLRVTDGGS